MYTDRKSVACFAETCLKRELRYSLKDNGFFNLVVSIESQTFKVSSLAKLFLFRAVYASAEWVNN